MNNLENLIDLGNKLRVSAYIKHENGFKYFAGNEFYTWIAKLKIYIQSLSSSNISVVSYLAECDSFGGFNDISHFEKIMGFLNACDEVDLQSTSNISPEGLKKGNKKTVFVVHGRNNRILLAMRDLLRAMGVDVLEWEQCVTLTNTPTPSIQQILEAGFRQAQAIIILFTPDEEAHLREGLGNKDECQVGLQPRLNVIYEAGMAMGIMPDRTVLVNFGRLRGLSDLAGIHFIDFLDDAQSRQSLANRLKLAGVEIFLEGKTDWLRTGAFPPTV